MKNTIDNNGLNNIYTKDDFGYTWYKINQIHTKNKDIQDLLSFDFFIPEGYYIKKISYIDPQHNNDGFFILPNKNKCIYTINGKCYNTIKNKEAIILSKINPLNNNIIDNNDDIVIYDKILAISIEKLNKKSDDTNNDVNNNNIQENIVDITKNGDEKTYNNIFLSTYSEYKKISKLNNEKAIYEKFTSNTNNEIKKVEYNIPYGWKFIDNCKYGNTYIQDKIFFDNKLYEIVAKYKYDNEKELLFDAVEIDKYTGEYIQQNKTLKIYKSNLSNICKVRMDDELKNNYKWATKDIIEKKFNNYEKINVTNLNNLNIGDFFITKGSNDVFMLKYKKENLVGFTKDTKKIIAVATNTKTKKDEFFYNNEICVVLDKKTILNNNFVFNDNKVINIKMLNTGDYFVEKGNGDIVYKVIKKTMTKNNICVICRPIYSQTIKTQIRNSSLLDRILLNANTEKIFYLNDQVFKVLYKN